MKDHASHQTKHTIFLRARLQMIYPGRENNTASSVTDKCERWSAAMCFSCDCFQIIFQGRIWSAELHGGQSGELKFFIRVYVNTRIVTKCITAYVLHGTDVCKLALIGKTK